MKTLIIGSGVSGLAVYNYLKNVDVEIYNNSNKNINNYLKTNLNKYNQIIVSPGIKLNINIIFQIKKNKIAFYGELEFGVRKIKNDIIAITGTNGKTTTVSMVGFLLKNYIGGVRVGGNIGVPVTSLIDNLAGDESC